MQVPVAVGVTLYEGIGLYRGNKVIASKGDTDTHVTVSQLMVYATCGIVAGLVGGLLGLGGGFIMGPMFLELGVPPQVSSATATFAMTFSSSMSVVEYYLLKRFPVPYGRRAARTTQQEYVKLQEWKNQERTHRHQQQSPESWHTHRHNAVARTGRRAQHNTAYSQTQHRNTDTNSRARKLDWSFSLAGTLRQGAQCSV